MTATKVVRCMRCRKRNRGHGQWNIEWVAGYAAGSLCPECQTIDEDLAAQVNEVLNHPSTWRTQHVSNMTADDKHNYILQLIDRYPNPTIMRAKAAILAAGRPDCRQGPVKMMLRIADDMESGVLYDDDDDLTGIDR